MTDSNCAVILRRMRLKTYLLSMLMPDRLAFAARCGTTYAHLRLVAYGRSCNPQLAVEIERESGGKVLVEDLCPDVDWQYIRASAARSDAVAA